MSARPQPPEQIVGAWQAWLATCVLQVAGALTTLAINLLNPGALLEVPGMGGQSVGDAFPELGADDKLLVARGSAVMTMPGASARASGPVASCVSMPRWCETPCM